MEFRYCDLMESMWSLLDNYHSGQQVETSVESYEISDVRFIILVIIPLRLAEDGATTPKLVSG